METTITGDIRVILGFPGITEKKMETTIMSKATETFGLC